MPRLNMCREKDGYIVHDGNGILDRWAENFEGILNIGVNINNFQVVANREDHREIDAIPTLKEI